MPNTGFALQAHRRLTMHAAILSGMKLGSAVHSNAQLYKVTLSYHHSAGLRQQCTKHSATTEHTTFLSQGFISLGQAAALSPLVRLPLGLSELLIPLIPLGSPRNSYYAIHITSFTPRHSYCAIHSQLLIPRHLHPVTHTHIGTTSLSLPTSRG